MKRKGQRETNPTAQRKTQRRTRKKRPPQGTNQEMEVSQKPETGSN
jgi:hypothetical protein